MTSALKFKNEEAQRLTGEHISFSFGENWKKFLTALDEPTIQAAVESFRSFTKISTLEGKTFLDIGSGSGLSSLVAARLGAERILSIDVDTSSVECTRCLREKFPEFSSCWSIEHASILDDAKISTFGNFSYVYSWGVLHHTGAMWRALENAQRLVSPGGAFHIALYNNSRFTREWTVAKRICNRWPFVLPIARDSLFGLVIAKKILTGQNPRVALDAYRERRGMSVIRDIEDWLGGYPYEASTPGEVASWLADRGYCIERLETTSGIGCNEFLARKS